VNPFSRRDVRRAFRPKIQPDPGGAGWIILGVVLVVIFLLIFRVL
jgi:hypothetical protein